MAVVLLLIMGNISFPLNFFKIVFYRGIRKCLYVGNGLRYFCSFHGNFIIFLCLFSNPLPERSICWLLQIEDNCKDEIKQKEWIKIIIPPRYIVYWGYIGVTLVGRLGPLVCRHFLWALFLSNPLSEVNITSQEWLIPSLVVHIVGMLHWNYF